MEVVEKLKFYTADPLTSGIGLVSLLVSSMMGGWGRFWTSRRVSKVICQTLYNCNLVMIDKDKDGNTKVAYPKVTVKTNGYNLYIEFAMIAGQTAKEWESKIDAFAHALCGRLVSYEIDRGTVYLVIKIAERQETRVATKNDDLNYLVIGYDDEGKKVYWEFDSSPHMLLMGATGSGKSTFVRSILSQFPNDWELQICDGKEIEFNWLRDLGYDVIDTVDGFVGAVKDCQKEVNDRFKAMRKEAVNNYTDLGLKPRFLVVDEFIYLMESVSGKKAKGEVKSERDKVFDLLRDISLRGRAAGVFLVLILQRPDASFLPTVIRDNLTTKIALANPGSTGLEMAFGQEGKQLTGLSKGQGYYKDDLSGIKRFSFGYLSLEDFKRGLLAGSTP